MVFVSDIFAAAMALMDELSPDGSAQSGDTKEYEGRTPAIVNIMVSELKLLVGDRESWLPLGSMDELVPEASAGFALGAMPYGLAANLLVDENPTAASFYQQRYEQLLGIYSLRTGASVDSIENYYGGLEYKQFGRW